LLVLHAREQADLVGAGQMMSQIHMRWGHA
jgi:hypothetical protein